VSAHTLVADHTAHTQACASSRKDTTMGNENERAKGLDVTNTISPAHYAEGYRICANAEARVHQIDLITTVLAQVGAGARQPVVGLAMKLAQLPAQRAGWGEL